MECHACRLKGHKIKEWQTKQNIYIANLKETIRSKLEIQDEMQQYGNIKSIKGTLSGLRHFLTTESPLKVMKNVFCFSLNALFVLKISKFLF